MTLQISQMKLKSVKIQEISGVSNTRALDRMPMQFSSRSQKWAERSKSQIRAHALFWSD